MPIKSYQILIDLGKLKKLYSGLGQYSLQFANFIKEIDSPILKWNFMVPKESVNHFGASINYEQVSLKRRFLPTLCKKYDIWHAIHQDSAYFPSDKKTPYILTIHDLNFLEEKNPFTAKRRLKTLQKKADRAAAITFISNYTEKVAIKNLSIKNKITRVIHNGVAIDVNGAGQRPEFIPNGKFLFAIGMILEKKNFHILIDFMQRIPEYKLIIAGDKSDHYARKMEHEISIKGLSNQIVLPGIISEKDKIYLYKNCIAFLFPSKMEGFGLPVIEAMRFGKPVFCSTYSSLPEIGGDMAFFWKSFDPDEMAEFFNKKISEFEYDKELFAQRITDYSKQFNWEKSIAAYIDLYMQVVADYYHDSSEDIPVSGQSENIKVLHLSSEKSWRGGEQQIAYLLEELNKTPVKNYIVCHKGSEFEKYCKKNNLPYQALNFNTPYNLYTAYSISRIIQQNDIDILHMHTSVSHTIGVLSTLFNHNAKLVLARRVDFPINKNLLSRWKYNHPRIKKIIGVSNAITSIVNESIIKSDLALTIHSGVNVNRFKQKPMQNLLREKYKIPSERYLIGNTSALANHKDYFTFVNTAEYVLNKKIPATFFIIGDGPEKKEIEKYIQSKSLESFIIMTGFLNNIVEILPCLDIYLMTSHMEGLGTTVLDAFACGIPVVATKAGGIPEMVIHGETGLLSEVRDFAGLGENIMNLIENTDLSKKLSVNANAFLIKEFSKENMASKTLDAYKSVLSTNQ